MATLEQRIYWLNPACWPPFWICSQYSYTVKISDYFKSLEFSGITPSRANCAISASDHAQVTRHHAAATIHLLVMNAEALSYSRILYCILYMPLGQPPRNIAF